jgi:two-component system capsular synthesis sensor histidine kinase RcsC
MARSRQQKGIDGDRLLAAVSHDMRSQLQSIATGLDTVQFRAGEGLAPELALLRRSVAAMDSRLRDLRTLGQSHEGQVIARPRRFDACQVVTAAAQTCADQARAKGLEFTVTTPDGAVELLGSPSDLAQVVGKLVENAVRYTQRGSVAVQLERVAGGEPTIRVAVEDSGPGMPLDVLESLRSTGTQVVGTVRKGRCALGLAVACRLSERLGGRVIVERSDATGTRVSVCLVSK